MKLIKKTFPAIVVLLILSIAVTSCYKDTPEPPNPYDAIDYPTTPAPVDTVDPTSFVALHRNIFATRCAVPGCHDGHFEPDFRTLQSAYSTLVYHPIIKNNADSTFQFRVIPLNKEESVLYERLTNCCFVNQDDRMPQDNIGVPLESNHISNIAAWIDNGARDIFGALPSYPNQEPLIGFYLALNTDLLNPIIYSNNRIDGVYYNPFILPNNTDFYIAIQVTDDSTATSALQYNKFKMSYDPDDFSPSAPGYREYTANYFQNGNDEAFLALINSGDFIADSVVYFRYFVNDGDHQQNTQFPRDESIIQYKTFYSFYVTP
ncbi:MAG: hypothetical protein POELPBGB_01766 [Bacteroidia bacterium]|nr:hypothetical protein [Bacteroidia bacterium]